MLYLAYGSNLNKKQMSRRCPNATPVGSVILKGFKLEFRRVATIKHTKKTDDKLGCGLWEITEKCEKFENLGTDLSKFLNFPIKRIEKFEKLGPNLSDFQIFQLKELKNLKNLTNWDPICENFKILN